MLVDEHIIRFYVSVDNAELIMAVLEGKNQLLEVLT